MPGTTEHLNDCGMVCNGMTDNALDGDKDVKGKQRDCEASSIAARKQRRVDADVIAAIGEGDAGNSDCGSDAGLRALWRVMSVNPATDTDKDREKAQKSNPIAG